MPTTPEKPTTEIPSSDKPSLLNEPAPEGAPEKYEFKAPDGFELDAETMKAAEVMFRDLGLTQASAQRLVDFYAAKSLEAAKAPVDYYQEIQQKWQAEVRADPEIGSKLDTVKTTIGRALDGLGDPKLAHDFRVAMDFTGAGNNPAFIRAFYKLAQKVTEGTIHVTGSPRGTSERPRSPAQAIYPNLPSGG